MEGPYHSSALLSKTQERACAILRPAGHPGLHRGRPVSVPVDPGSLQPHSFRGGYHARAARRASRSSPGMIRIQNGTPDTKHLPPSRAINRSRWEKTADSQTAQGGGARKAELNGTLCQIKDAAFSRSRTRDAVPSIEYLVASSSRAISCARSGRARTNRTIAAARASRLSPSK